MSHTLTWFDGVEGTSLVLAGTATTGYHLQTYSPSMAVYSEQRNESLYNSGSVSVQGKYGNIVETITVEIVGTTRDDLFVKLRALYRAVENARDWVQFPSLRNPSYLAYKPDSTTNTSYSCILGGRVDIPGTNSSTEGEQLSNVMTGIVITIEREPFWRALPPVMSLTRSDWATEINPFVNAAPVQQLDYIIVVGTIGAAGAGNATVVVTSFYLTGSPITLSVAVANNDTASQVATKIAAALVANAVINSQYIPSANSETVLFYARYVRPNDTTLNLSIANGTCTGLTAVPASVHSVASTMGRIAQFQVETATVVGTIGAAGAGNATVIVTVTEWVFPRTLDVAVANNDTATLVAGKIRAAMIADTGVIAAVFAISGSGANVVLTRLTYSANDAAINISIDNGTCTGLTAAPTSANTTAGYAGNQIGNAMEWGKISFSNGVTTDPTTQPEIPGDIPALTEIRIAPRNAADTPTLDHVIFGYRSAEKSFNKDQYANCGAYEAEGDASSLATLYNSSSLQTDETASPGLGNTKVRTSFATIAIDVKRQELEVYTSLIGTHRLFARMKLTTPGSATVHANMQTIDLTEIPMGITATVAETDWRMYDLGAWTMNFSETTFDQLNGFHPQFALYAARTSGASELEIDMLFIMPIDEYLLTLQGGAMVSGYSSIYRAGNVAPVSLSAQTAYNPADTDIISPATMGICQWAGNMRFPVGAGTLYWLAGNADFGNTFSFEAKLRLYLYYVSLYLTARGNG